VLGKNIEAHRRHHKSQYLITTALVEESSKTELITFCSCSRPAPATHFKKAEFERIWLLGGLFFMPTGDARIGMPGR